MFDIFKSFFANLSDKEREAFSKYIAPKIPVVLPYHRPPPSTVNPAEFIALRVIIMALVAEAAGRHEASDAGSARDWINQISVRCQESILAAEISGESAERPRREAMDHVNLILGGIRDAKRKNVRPF